MPCKVQNRCGSKSFEIIARQGAENLATTTTLKPVFTGFPAGPRAPCNPGSPKSPCKAKQKIHKIAQCRPIPFSFKQRRFSVTTTKLN